MNTSRRNARRSTDYCSDAIGVQAGERTLVFRLSRHARQRASERRVSHGAIKHTLLDVIRQLPEAIQNRHTVPKVVIPRASSGAALLVALDAGGGTIITVLEYPLMAFPSDAAILQQTPRAVSGPNGRVPAPRGVATPAAPGAGAGQQPERSNDEHKHA